MSFLALCGHILVLWFMPETKGLNPTLCSSPCPQIRVPFRRRLLPNASISRYWQRLRSTPQSISTMLRHHGLKLVLIIFVGKRIAFASENFIYQYASEKTKRKLSDTIVARVSHLTGAILITSCILPALTLYWNSVDIHILRKDLWIIHGSLQIAVVSFIGLFLSETFRSLCVSTFGTGLPDWTNLLICDNMYVIRWSRRRP